jgi:transposase-like protein
MYNKINKLRSKRTFSVEFKKQIVSQFESGKNTILQLSKLYGLRATNIYNWIYKYSNFNEKSTTVVEMKNSQMNRMKELENLNKELSSLLGNQLLELEFYKHLITIASKELNIDLKKNFSTLPSNSSGKKTEEKK